ncbi:MAG: MurR/RpiR family transcriptional regulator [Limnochordia bacterium]|nr:MurR/RpiR family transcriptional regulator [Limnochordia bacterium]MDI9464669.1 MurR/RpiR family transcriptional regulator [Bacillota bacterium]HOB40369.1 MurR/RpiR family transcriptional regulator [Limnochordia bacterium]HOK31070.1 MurR/RpiR family transcriptional regulator [Limnochordia bacterium]HOL99651.1 MurR/RpiR family transcriptional regulator [Limnochordia bacterium]
MSRLANALLHIRGTYPALRPAEKRVAQVILSDPREAVHYSITQLAEKAEVSDATVVKFCKRLGYKGYQEFKIMLAQDVAVKPQLIHGEVEPGNDVQTIKEKIFQANISALQETAQVLETEALERAVQALANAGEIHFYGVGASGIVALDAEQKFSRIGLRTSAFLDTHLQIARAVHLREGDVAVCLSFSGETVEIVEALRAAKQAGALTIAITSFSGSTLAREADVLLLTSTQQNLFRSGAIASRLTQLSTIDVLFIAVALVDHERAQEAIEKTRAILSQRRLERLKGS